MRKTITLLLVLTLTASSLSLQPIKAESQTIVVPDDYVNIASAIGNATEGATIFVRSGTYLEHSLIISKTLTLMGENVETTIIRNIDEPQLYFTSALMAGPTTITVEKQAEDVVITGLTIETNNVGVDHSFEGFSIASYGNRTQIFNNHLPEGVNFPQYGNGVSGSYQLVTNNTIGQVADNFAIISNAPYSYIVNNSIVGGVKLIDPQGIHRGYLSNVIYANNISTTKYDYDWSAWGVNIYMSHGNLIAKNNIDDTYAGIVTAISTYNTIIGNSITNSYIGLASIQDSAVNNFSQNTIRQCSFSAAASGFKNYYYENNFIDNLNELADPNTIRGPNNDNIVYWYQGNHGNFWSNYDGFDANNDGIGDTSYRINANNSDPFPLMAPFEATSVSLPDWTNSMIPESLSPTVPAPKATQPPSSTPTSPPPISPTNTLAPTSSPTLLPTQQPTINTGEIPSQNEPFPTTFVVAALIIGITAFASLLIYYMKRRSKIDRR